MDDSTVETQRFRRLVWLLPAAFALHIVEEYTGEFPGWVTHVLGGSFNNLAFAANNAGFMAIMLALTAWTSGSGSRLASFLLIGWASANLFWDGLFHIATTAALDRYSPGLVTSSLLYIPISLLIGWSSLRSRALSLRALFGAVAARAALFGFVVWYGLFHFAL
jgi:hypothetical protein